MSVKVISSYNGFIAPKDIEVYIPIYSRDDKYYTAEGIQVTLDSENIPRKPYPDIIYKSSHNHCILDEVEGVIHSYLSCWGDYHKAIIREGTRFWISPDLEHIFSLRLWISSEKACSQLTVGYGKLSFLYPCLCLDLVKKTGEMVSWPYEVNMGEVLGMYLGDRIISLDWYIHKLDENHYFIKDSSKSPLRDMDGRLNTDYLNYLIADPNSIFNVSPSNCYIPALGELMMVFKNLFLINLTRRSLLLTSLPKDMTFFSSTVVNPNTMYVLRSSPDWMWDKVNINAQGKGIVLPFMYV